MVSIAKVEQDTNLIRATLLSLSIQEGKGIEKCKDLDCWENPLLLSRDSLTPIPTSRTASHLQLEAATPLGLELEGRVTFVKRGYEDVMGDNFYKENKMNNLGMVGLEQSSESSLGSEDHLIPPATPGPGRSPLWDTIIMSHLFPQSPYR